MPVKNQATSFAWVRVLHLEEIQGSGHGNGVAMILVENANIRYTASRADLSKTGEIPSPRYSPDKRPTSV